MAMKKLLCILLLAGSAAFADTTNNFTVVLTDRTENILTVSWKLNNWRRGKDGLAPLTKKQFAEELASQALADAAERLANDIQTLLSQKFEKLTDAQKIVVLDAATP
jgi:hypothetical protein